MEPETVQFGSENGFFSREIWMKKRKFKGASIYNVVGGHVSSSKRMYSESA